MGVLIELQNSIRKVGIKEVARRTGLAASTVSRINSGLMSPSLEVVERISDAVGFQLELLPRVKFTQAPRLKFAKQVLNSLRKQLKSLGVRHVVIYGSVARGTDTAKSDIDIFLDFGKERPGVSSLLRAEGLVIEAFGKNKADVVSNLDSPKGQRLKKRIEKEGICVF